MTRVKKGTKKWKPVPARARFRGRRPSSPQGPPRGGAQCITVTEEAKVSDFSLRRKLGRVFWNRLFPFWGFSDFCDFWDFWGRPGSDQARPSVSRYLWLNFCFSSFCWFYWFAVCFRNIFFCFFCFPGVFRRAVLRVCTCPEFWRKSLTPSNDFWFLSWILTSPIHLSDFDDFLGGRISEKNGFPKDFWQNFKKKCHLFLCFFRRENCLQKLLVF